jgi:hypothetical protein
VTEFVHASNPLSVKLIELQSKVNAVEDCMNLVKKNYDKDNIDLQTMLKLIRGLANKQCKSIQKIRKLMTA